MSRHPPEAFAAVEQYMTEHGHDLEGLDDRPWQHGQVHDGCSTAAIDALLQPRGNPHDGILPSSRASPQDSYNMRSLELTDLNILSAATHADSQIMEQRVGAPRTSNQTSFAFQLNDNASEEPGLGPSDYGGFQKMSGRSSGDSDEDQSTKQRGRPRLDKRDATAADRRRTQIRLAQRAYRLRKENTISSLQSKVSKLTSTIDEMSRSCSRLNEDARSSGIMHLSPNLAHELQQTTEYLSSLAKTATLDSDHDPELDPDASLRSSKSAEPDEYKVSRRNQRSRQESATQGAQSQQMLGYQVTYSDVEDIMPSVEDYDPSSRYAQITPSPVPKALAPTYTYSFQKSTLPRRPIRASIERAYRLLGHDA